MDTENLVAHKHLPHGRLFLFFSTSTNSSSPPAIHRSSGRLIRALIRRAHSSTAHAPHPLAHAPAPLGRGRRGHCRCWRRAHPLVLRQRTHALTHTTWTLVRHAPDHGQIIHKSDHGHTMVRLCLDYDSTRPARAHTHSERVLPRLIPNRFCSGAPPWAEREGEKHKDG